MSYHVPDMDHDSEITSKDAGIFHEMMDSEGYCPPNYGKSAWDIFGECIMLAFLVFATPIVVLHIIGWLGRLLN